MVVAAFLSWPLAGLAVDVGLAGVMSGKALLTINGGSPQSVVIGQSVNGVKLVAIADDQVIVEVDGKKRPLRVGQHAVGSGVTAGPGEGSDSVTLIGDSRGHFVTDGMVNGKGIRFMVDTGATLVALGASDARRAGIDSSKGKRAVANTANGQTAISIVRLDSVRVGDVTLYNVDAAVHEHDLPVALLGMSFLNRMEMQRDGSTMKLKKRF